jgi:hypothetical protein
LFKSKNCSIFKNKFQKDLEKFTKNRTDQNEKKPEEITNKPKPAINRKKTKTQKTFGTTRSNGPRLSNAPLAGGASLRPANGREIGFAAQSGPFAVQERVVHREAQARPLTKRAGLWPIWPLWAVWPACLF